MAAARGAAADMRPGASSDGRWLTNLHRSDIEEYRKTTGGPFVLGPPRRTKELTVERLNGLGMVGIYRRKGVRR